MEANASAENPNGLPLSCLRLIVPPLRLLSAALWQVAKRREVLSYDKLQDFVFMVTEAFPGLLTQRQRAQLLLGLRARLILELCKGSVRGAVDLQAVQNHLERLPVSSSHEPRDADLERTESMFISLVQSLLKDPTERAYFFQEVFPVEYGPSYDGALHILLWELLSKLEKVFTVPDLKQTAAWLNSDLCAADDCLPTMGSDLSQIHQHHKNLGLLKTQCGPSSAIGGCILSAMSIPPSQKVCKAPSVGLEAIHNYAHLVNPLAFVEAEQYSMVTVYEVEVELGATEVSGDLVDTSEEICLQTEDLSAVVSEHDEEVVEEEVEEEEARMDGEKVEEGEGEDVATALETLTMIFVQKDEMLQGKNEPEINLNALPVTEAEEAVTMEEGSECCAEPIHLQEEQGSLDAHLLPGGSDSPGSSESIRGELGSANELTCPGEGGCGSTAKEEPLSESPPSLGVGDRSSCHLHIETLTSGQQVLQLHNSSQQIMKKVDASIAPSVIAIKGLNTDDSGEQVSIIFTCPQCPFHHREGGAEEEAEEEENAPPHIHMQSVPAEEFRALMAAKSDGAEFVPTPGATDQIFTSIKVLPQGNAETARKEAKPDRPGDDGPPDDGADDDDPSPAGGRRKALTCGTCGRTFTRTADVRRHQLTHTGERPFRCSQCERTFQHSWDLAKHEARHHGAAVAFACTACGCSFGNLRRLTAHHRGAHAGQSRLPQICSICGRSFAAAAELLEHRRSHGDRQRYPCRQCGDTFDTMLARSQHRQSHHAKRHFKCPHCDKTYTRRSDVKRHQATHTGDRPHQCSQCGKRFSLRFMLAKHLTVHTGQRPFQCAHCPKRFTLVSILTRHERMHTGEKPFLCSHCGKGFLSQGELSKHQRSHADDKPYACIQCDKRFKSKRSQREHVLSHTGARPYLCTHCGKGFTKLYALTRHNLIHTGERPFPCAHCGKAFLTLGEARLHQRIHTGERPYACGVCHLKFKSSSELGRHKRSHAGAKAWRLSCEQCGKSFSSQGRLTKHMDGHAAGLQGAPSQGSPSADCGQQGAPSAD
ncbi:zinc finger protein 648-like isoform X1 [Gadus chalcogrammus]|uniref:zinc finger protein 648-like isoform X1 n=1 Tax=Gadus chalcogrammus TaxID=1042646 RepID=UPI0024C4CE00|nr:zinc finger protein 648-like isoform X1 [Gadus chalcogrammus]